MVQQILQHLWIPHDTYIKCMEVEDFRISISRDYDGTCKVLRQDFFNIFDENPRNLRFNKWVVIATLGDRKENNFQTSQQNTWP